MKKAAPVHTAMVDDILLRAATLALDNHCHYIGTEHVLLAFLKHTTNNGESALAQVISDESTEAKLIETVETLVQNPSRPVYDKRIPYKDAKVDKVLELAKAAAEQLRDGFIGSEHLIIGLVRETDSSAFRILSKYGVTDEELTTAVASIPNRV